jgi:cell division protease FtsH
VKSLLRPPRVFILLAVVTLLSGIVALRQLGSNAKPVTKLDLSAYEKKIAAGEVATADIHDRDAIVTGKLADGTKYRSAYPARYVEKLTEKLLAKNVTVKPDSQPSSPWLNLLYTFLPMLLIIAVLVWFVSSQQGQALEGRWPCRHVRRRCRY